MFPTVAVQGNGIAACCCVQLLRNSSFQVYVERAGRPSQLIVLLSPGTQRLLSDIFGSPDLLSGLPPISKRVVLWGQQSHPLTLPHSGVGISEASLLRRLWDRLGSIEDRGTVEPDWRIHSRKGETPAQEQQFGSRIAAAVEIRLKQTTDCESCWIESLPDGWLFLLPCELGRGSLLAVGAAPDVLLGQSRLVAKQVQSCSAITTNFPAYPRIADRLCAPGWLLCGTAAMGFDPICGEGAGNAAREAILASAALRAIQSGADIQGVLHHYSSRLLAGFLRHLYNCKEFYLSGRNGPWWEAELEQLERGIEWTGAQLSELPRTSFQLVDFDLRPRIHADKRI